MAILGQFRGDTEEAWLSEDPVIQDREFILIKKAETDANWTYIKIGDGIHKYSELPLWTLASATN